MYEFRLKIHWRLFLRIQSTINQHWFREWLGADQATSHYLKQWWLVYWRIYPPLGLNELSKKIMVTASTVLQLKHLLCLLVERCHTLKQAYVDLLAGVIFDFIPRRQLRISNGSGAHLTDDFSIVIHIRCTLYLPLAQLSLQGFAHDTTAVLSWHMQNFIAISFGRNRTVVQQKFHRI